MNVHWKDKDVAQDSAPSWQQLLDLIERLDGSEYDAVAIEFGDVSVRMSRGGALPDPSGAVEHAPAPGASRGGGGAGVHAAADLGAAAGDTEASGPVITAPMLGVFYRRPAPGAEPFVQPGDRVEPDTTIGIIEIMKLMNPVTAGVSGVIAEFAVEDGAQVQHGQVIARLES